MKKDKKVILPEKCIQMLAAFLCLSSSGKQLIYGNTIVSFPVPSGSLIITLNPTDFEGSYNYSIYKSVPCLGSTGYYYFNFTSSGFLNVANKKSYSQTFYYSLFRYSRGSPCTTTNVYLNAPVGHFFAAGSFIYNGYTNTSLSQFTTNCFFYAGGCEYAFETDSSSMSYGNGLYHNDNKDYGKVSHLFNENVDMRLKTGYSTSGYAYFKIYSKRDMRYGISNAYNELYPSNITCVGYDSCKFTRFDKIASYSSISTGAVVGIVIACIVVFLIPLICVICFCCGCFACFGCANSSMVSHPPTSQSSIDEALMAGQYPASQQYPPQQDAYAQQPQYQPQYGSPQQPYTQQYPPQMPPQQYPPQQMAPQQYPPQQYPPQQYPPQQMLNPYDVK